MNGRPNAAHSTPSPASAAPRSKAVEVSRRIGVRVGDDVPRGHRGARHADAPGHAHARRRAAVRLGERDGGDGWRLGHGVGDMSGERDVDRLGDGPAVGGGAHQF
jgi:hypothetical protein